MKKVHKEYTETFEGLTYPQQARSISMHVLTFRRMLDAHLRRAEEVGKDRHKVAKARLDLLRSVLMDMRSSENP